MKKNLLAVLMIAGLIFATSCKDEVEEPTLTLAETEWQAPMDAAEKSVAVTTNQTNWTAVPNVQWIETTQSGNTLTIKVDKNFETKTRKAIVKVIAGGIGKDITVVQAATNVTIVTIPDKLEVDQFGGNFQFDVDANTKDWAITSDADWAKVTAKQFKGEVAVEIAENVKREPRTAKLLLASNDGKEKKEFTITQSGILYYIMPYLEPGANYETIKKFEFARKSTEYINLDYVLEDPGSFKTISSAFPKIRYVFTKDKVSKIFLTASGKEILEDAEFAKMMTDEGFKPSGENYYVKDAGTVLINAQVIITTEFGVIFTFVPKQPKDMPTWSTLPLGFTDFGKGKPEVDAYEAKNGGTYNEAESIHQTSGGGYWFHWYDVKTTELLARAYFIMDDATKGLTETVQYYLLAAREKVFYEADDQFFVTKEFMALTAKEGFEYKGIVNKSHRFENSTRGLGISTRWVKYADMDEAVLDFHVFKVAGSSSASERLLKYKEDNKPFNMNSWEARSSK